MIVKRGVSEFMNFRELTYKTSKSGTGTNRFLLKKVENVFNQDRSIINW
jgi:hypothetical protein